jgi:hypothetical protein
LAAATRPTVFAAGLGGYSYALNEKINRKTGPLHEKSAHPHALAGFAPALSYLSGQDERTIHPELMQVSLILVS